MRKMFWVLVITIGLIAFGSCDKPTEQTKSNNEPANTATAPVKEEPAKDLKTELSAAENEAWTAFSKKDGKFFESFLADNFMGSGADGRSTKADAVKGISESKCEVKSFRITDEDAVDLGGGAALFTAKVESEFTCDGKAGPTPIWTATVFVKDGENWKAAFHQEMPAADAKSELPPPPKSESKPIADTDKDLTNAISDVEKKLWETWAKKDAKGFEEGISKDHREFDSSKGRMDKATALKEVAENKCEVKSASQGDFVTTKISDTVAVITYKASLDAVCDGNPAPKNSWSSSVYVKEGDKWLSAFYMGTPAS